MPISLLGSIFMNLDIEHLGQVFTPQHVVVDMLALVKNNGRFLEPIVAPSIFKFLLEHHITYKDTRDIYIHWNKGLSIYKITLSPKA